MAIGWALLLKDSAPGALFDKRWRCTQWQWLG